MVTGGTEVTIGVTQEPVFGPLIVFGLGGVATDVLGDRSARLTPLTDTGAAALIRPSAPPRCCSATAARLRRTCPRCRTS